MFHFFPILTEWCECLRVWSAGTGAYPGIGVVQHHKYDEDVRTASSLDRSGDPLLPLQKQTSAVRHDQQQLSHICGNGRGSKQNNKQESIWRHGCNPVAMISYKHGQFR